MDHQTDPLALQAEALRRRAEGQRIGFVPTMGYLHQGHTSLMDIARSQCDWLVVSIFVNPLQFGPSEDLDRYPRDPEGDAAKCAGAGVDTLFMPQHFYPSDHSTSVAVAGLTDGFCGASRPNFFGGITTVVSRLFGIVQPSVAVFGEKDFQQLAVIRRMVRDLAMPIEVIGGPLIRDTDGLAMSSRNRYLTPERRQRALSLSGALKHMQALLSQRGAGTSAETLLAAGREILDFDEFDYLQIVDPDTLKDMPIIDRSARALVGGYIGGTRLIDNMALIP
ncbi:MAG: pantoate--beta-alanine ligase [Myxococcota bacterium]|nr:pantoate--beta-alanine ligase [Myxococcota bacterium]